MGYDLQVTRALMAFDSEWYPILDAEVQALARDERAKPALDKLRFAAGRLTAKNPDPGLVGRMIDLAARLDAWVIGEDGEWYVRDGDCVVARQRGPEAFAWNRRFLTRGTWLGGMNAHAPIRPGEWARLVAAQPDFTTMTRIEATLPSGVRWIACPPVACWTGHPSGRVMPFFFDVDVIEVRHAHEPAVRRMTALATALGAKVVDDCDVSPA
ncbi:hypothetical protein [Actinoplanes sp. URMC 104]|uniref:hypothetical protein n=1 Tax=Actinoplanes sp. URMC 104 TaxID=3423409 RepID=UPI003F1E02D6